MADNNTTQKEYVLKLTANTEDFNKKLDRAAAALKNAGDKAEACKKMMEKAGEYKGDGIAKTTARLGRVSSEYDRITGQLVTTINQARKFGEEISATVKKHEEQSKAVAKAQENYDRLSRELNEARKNQARMQEAMANFSGDEAYKRASAAVKALSNALVEANNKLNSQKDGLANAKKELEEYTQARINAEKEYASATGSVTTAKKRIKYEYEPRRERALERRKEMLAEAGDRNPEEVFGNEWTQNERGIQRLNALINGATKIVDEYTAKAEDAKDAVANFSEKEAQAAENVKQYEAGVADAAGTVENLSAKLNNASLEESRIFDARALIQQQKQLQETIAETTKRLSDEKQQRQELSDQLTADTAKQAELKNTYNEQVAASEKTTQQLEIYKQELKEAREALKELDRQGGREKFGEEYDKAAQRVQDLKIKVEAVKRTLSAQTREAAKTQTEIQNLGGSIESVTRQLGEMDQKITSSDAELKGYEATLKSVVEWLTELKQKAGIDFSDADMAAADKQVKDLEKSTGEAGNVLAQTRSEADATQTTINSLTDSFSGAVDKADKLTDSLETAGDKMKSVSDALGGEMDARAKAYSANLAYIKMNIEKAGAAAEKYNQQVESVKNIGGGNSSLRSMAKELGDMAKTYSSQATQLANVETQVVDYRGKLEDLTFTYEEQKRELDGLIARRNAFQQYAQKAEAEAAAIKALPRDEEGKPVTRAIYGVAALERAEEYKQKVAELDAQIEKQTESTAKAKANVDEMSASYREAKGEAGKLTMSVAALRAGMESKSAILSFLSNFELLKQSIATTHTAFAKIGGAIKDRLITPIKTAANWVKKLSSRIAQSVKHNKTLNNITGKLGKSLNSLGNIAKRLLARLAIRAVLQDIGNAMKALAKQFDDFNQTMNGLGGGTKQLVAQMAAAFGSLIQQIAPILNQILDMLINFVNTVTQVFAVLGGSGTWRRAVRGAYDFSGAMDSAAGSAGGAADAQEELNRQLLGFDQINKLNEAKDSTGGGGGGGGAGSDDDGAGAFQWVEEEVPKTNLTEWVDKLRKAFEDHDWPGIGKTFADGINQAFSWIQDATSWENVGDKITSFIDNFAASFNTFISSLDTYNIGATIGGAINTISNTITELEDSINWDEIGTKIGEGLNGLADKLDLSKAAEAFTKKFNILVDVIGNFASTVNWDKIGTDIADALNTMFDTFNWEDAGTAISNFVNGMLLAIDDIIYKTDWQAVGESLGQMLAKIDWKEALAEATALIVDVFTGLFAVIGGMLDELLGRSSTAESYEEAKANYEEKLSKSPMTEKQVAKLAEQLESGERDQSSIPNYVLEVVRAYQEMKKWEELINNPERTQHQSSSVESHGGSGVTVEAGQIQEERPSEKPKPSKPSVKPNLPVLDENTPYYIDEGGVKNTIKANKQLEKSTSGYSKALDGTVGTAKRAEKASISYGNTKNAELKTITRVTDGLVGANNRAETSTKTAAVRMSSSWSGAATSINYSVKPLTTQIPSLFEQAMRNSETKMKGAEKGLTSTATRISTSVGTTVKDSLRAAFAIDLTETGAKAGKSYAEGLKNSDLKTPSIVERVKSGLNFDLSGTGYTVGKSYGLALKDAIESTKIKTPQIVSRGSHTLSGTNVSAPRYAIEWYAQGGFPDVGQLFMSRENGPEMVGQIGGHTAVANNDQIVAAVSAGVARAVGSVLSQNMSRDEQGGDLVVRIDSEEIYRAALKGQRKVNKRTNPVFATI